MYDNGDTLLFALSAWGRLTWRAFRRCFDEIQRRTLAASQAELEDNVTGSRWRAIRELSALAHIDLHLVSNQPQVVVSPPTLATLPGHRHPRAVLCGARSPELVNRVEVLAKRNSVEILVESQAAASPYSPARILLRANEPDLFRQIAESANIRHLSTPPARLLARVSTSLQDYCRDLEWSDQPEINWPKQDFNVGDLRFHTSTAPGDQRRLTRYQNPSTTLWEYRLWQDNQSATVAPDWGRYAALAFSSRKVLLYDPDSRSVTVPHRAQLPALLARAFGMCTGYCPRNVDATSPLPEGSHHEFTSLPPSLFNAVASKLGQ